MKWSALFLLVFPLNSMSMENDFLHQIPDAYVKKVKERIRKRTGPKKMVNLVNRSCQGNLALKAYVLGETWFEGSPFAVNFCADPIQFFIEINQQAKQCNDQLAIEVSQIMHAHKVAGRTSATSFLEYAIQLNTKRGLGFLIQMGQDLNPEHLSLSIQKGLPHLTTFLLKAGCPVELSYTLLQEHPLVVAVKKRDPVAVRMLLPYINPKKKFGYPDSMDKAPITIEEYLSKEDLKYVDEVEEWAANERIQEKRNLYVYWRGIS